ncbi:MbnP family protein [Haloferula rosea]|uniref:Cytochrome C peroxidase n=1 Tax=Haloferula rosea TaxID=490093 RepID=A0A934VAG6_9BACT|nr:MbnP family protein [Haloferula rosea]MBK1826278.1 cytochrome C peroxidase [Haloferula rosea]
MSSVDPPALINRGISVHGSALLAAVILAISNASAASLDLVFTHFDSSAPLRFDSLRYKNHAGEGYSSTRLAYLIHDVRLAGAEGAASQHSDTVGFIDATRSRDRIRIHDVTPGHYQSITFHVGLDSALNHSDPAGYIADHPLNPNLNRLHWDWQGGYIFMALEGHWRKQGATLPEGYAYHFANDNNRTTITLNAGIEVTDETEVVLGLDLAKLLRGLSFEKDGATTHSQAGDPVASQLKNNLPEAFEVLHVRQGIEMPAQPRLIPIDLPASPTPFSVSFPRHIPIPKLPLDNPLIAERVALGERLFHDRLLSRTQEISCASCHQGQVMSDPRRFSLGVEGQPGPRHSMPLFNLAWKDDFFWDGRASSLRSQALVPIEDHLEMDNSIKKVIKKLEAAPDYPGQFAKAFGSGRITGETIGLAIENFLLTKMSFDSKFDRSMKGQTELSAEEKRGFELFFTESEPRLDRRGADCFHCHGGALFTDHGFHNTGLPPTEDLGLEATTGRKSDRYKFSTPSLRNIALTAPYMHDGRFATLEEVIDHYNTPFELSPTLDPNLAKHPQGLGLNEADKKALVAFLRSLTDPAMQER